MGFTSHSAYFQKPVLGLLPRHMFCCQSYIILLTWSQDNISGYPPKFQATGIIQIKTKVKSLKGHQATSLKIMEFLAGGNQAIRFEQIPIIDHGQSWKQLSLC